MNDPGSAADWPVPSPPPSPQPPPPPPSWPSPAPPPAPPPAALPPPPGSLPPGPGYGYLPPAPMNGLAIASMVSSIVGAAFLLSVCCMLLVAGLVGLVLPPIGGLAGGLAGGIMGHVARKQIQARGDRGAGMALSGIIIGWITVGLSVISVVLVLLAIAGFIALFASMDSELDNASVLLSMVLR